MQIKLLFFLLLLLIELLSFNKGLKNYMQIKFLFFYFFLPLLLLIMKLLKGEADPKIDILTELG